MKKWLKNVFPVCLFVLLPACEKQHGPTFQGYVEGEYVYMASSRPGRLLNLFVERGVGVDGKKLLFELEPEDELHVLERTQQELLSAKTELENMKTGRRAEEIAMAEAQLRQAKAEEANAVLQLKRYEKLASSGSVSKAQLDDARTLSRTTAARAAELASQVEVFRLPEREKKIEAQQAEVKAKEAQMTQARWALDQKRVSAPSRGLVYDTLFRVGEWVPAGSPVVQFLPPENVKIRFFVPEPFLGGISVGQKVSVYADGTTEPFSAVISYVAHDVEYTPPIIYSNETRSKLVFMIEAKPEPGKAGALHPGQPVSVSMP